MSLAGNLEMAGLQATSIEVASSGAKFDIFAAFIEREGEMMLRVEYSTELFAAVSIERMLGHFQTLLEGIVAKPERSDRYLPDPFRSRESTIADRLERYPARLSRWPVHSRIIRSMC